MQGASRGGAEAVSGDEAIPFLPRAQIKEGFLLPSSEGELLFQSGACCLMLASLLQERAHLAE